MNTASAGLQTSIWNNNFKSILLLLLYPLILGSVVFAAVAVFFYLYGVGIYPHGTQNTSALVFDSAASVLARYWPSILAVVVLWFGIAYIFQGRMIRALSHSHPVSRREEPDLYNLLENLCIAEGMTMPRLEIIETHARNAFASGIDQRSYCVTVTRGLMQSLSRDELEAVLAHELAHIRNRDVRLMMVCVIFTGMLGFAAQLAWSNFRYSLWIPRSNNRKSGSGIMLLLALIAILWLGYLATLLTRFAISRRREFMADAGAVSMTKNPDAMMRALIRISGAADIPKAPADIRAMCFENARPFLGLMATHPPIKDRIGAIAAYSGLPVPELPAKRRADDDAVFSRPGAGKMRENWTTRQRFKERRARNPWVQEER